MEKNNETKCLTSTTQNQVFPEEIELQILSYVPLKSMGRFKCVSKQWNRMLTLPLVQAIILLHRSRSLAERKLHLFVIYPGLGSSDKMELLSYDHPSYSKCPVGDHVTLSGYFNGCLMSNVCHGLVCHFKNRVIKGVELSVNLFSLRTKMSSTIRGSSKNVHDYINNIEATTSTTYFRNYCWCFLGFDTTMNQYKVLRVVSLPPKRNEYEILTLGCQSKSWIPISNEIVPPSLRKGFIYGTMSNSCYVDDVIYWIHETDVLNWDSKEMPILASYDLRRGTFRVFEAFHNKLVKMSSMNGCKCYLTTCNGCPTLLFCKPESKKLWKMMLENHKSSNAAWEIEKTNNPSICCSSNWPRCYAIANGIIIKRTQSSQDFMRDKPQCMNFLCYDLKYHSCWSLNSESVPDTVFRDSRVYDVAWDDGMAHGSIGGRDQDSGACE